MDTENTIRIFSEFSSIIQRFYWD